MNLTEKLRRANESIYQLTNLLHETKRELDLLKQDLPSKKGKVINLKTEIEKRDFIHKLRDTTFIS